MVKPIKVTGHRFRLDGKDLDFRIAFKKLLGKDKATFQTTRDIYSYLMTTCLVKEGRQNEI
jgi:hypothetical protein